MCNIYKNNLMLLSQLEEDQFIFYDIENNLKIDNRILGYFRNGTKENKIAIIINASFLHILNSYIINLVCHEKMNHQENEQLLEIEIENSKHLLRKALKGIQIYYETLVKNNYDYTAIEDLNNTLHNKLENLEQYKLEYLIKINNTNTNTDTSKSWLYKMYESTLKKEVVTNVIELESDSYVDEKNVLTENNSSNTNDNYFINSQYNNVEEPQLGDNFPEELEEEPGFIHGLLYIFSKKIVGLFFTIGKHVVYFF